MKKALLMMALLGTFCSQAQADTRVFDAVLMSQQDDAPSALEVQQWQHQVQQREQAFAQTMADRDFVAFARFIDDNAIFFNPAPVVGKAAVTETWRRFFEGKTAPFSWRPDQVVVTKDGVLAHSSGPVFDAQGKQIATFNSVWRRQADGSWKVVLDKGCQACACQHS